MSVGINIVDGLKGRPWEVVLRESVADVGLSIVGGAFGVGTDRFLSRLLGVNALVNRWGCTPDRLPYAQPSWMCPP